MDPTTPLSITLTREDWLTIAQCLTAQHATEHWALYWRIAGGIGRARMEQEKEAELQPVVTYTRTDARRQRQRELYRAGKAKG